VHDHIAGANFLSDLHSDFRVRCPQVRVLVHYALAGKLVTRGARAGNAFEMHQNAQSPQF
jgi:hypothetical protein